MVDIGQESEPDCSTISVTSSGYVCSAGKSSERGLGSTSRVSGNLRYRAEPVDGGDVEGGLCYVNAITFFL